MRPLETIKFIADINVGKLARWLRILGYDTLLFKGQNDSDMVTLALAEDRIILTRDSNILKRRLINKGQVKAILIKSDKVEDQLEQVISDLNLVPQPFVICVECNEPLIERQKEQVQGRVPEYVFKTQNHYMECTVCHRIYWKGTHWQAMTDRINRLKKG